MLTKSTIRLITSLRQRKFRRQEGLFVAEGPRLVGELLSVFSCRLLLATREWLETKGCQRFAKTIEEVTESELERISALQTPQQVVALFEIPDEKASRPTSLEGLHIALDGVQDPFMLQIGLGTAILTAQGFLPDAKHVLMKILELMLEHLTVTGLVKDLVKTIVQLGQLIQMPLFRMELSKVNVLFHFL